MTLEDYIAARGRGEAAKLAREIGVSSVTMHRWIHKGVRPDWRYIPAIERATGGKVTAADFVPRDNSPPAIVGTAA